MASRSRKVCYFSFVELDSRRGEYFMDVYVFDLDRKLGQNPSLAEGDLKMASVAPALRLRYKHLELLAPCVLNSRLYLFSGFDTGSVHSYDLSTDSCLESDCVITEPECVDVDSMESCFPMRGRKSSPRAIPTPDGQKILVFSTMIQKQQPREEGGFIHFELYDYANGESEALPLPPFPDSKPLSLSYFKVETYCFENGTTFAFRTDKHRAFALDLSRKPYCWKSDWGGDENEYIHQATGDAFPVCGGACFVSLDGLYHVSKKFGSNFFPNDPFPNFYRDYDSWGRMIALPAPLDVDGDGDEICLSYADFHCRVRPRPRVHILVHQIDPDTILPEEYPDSGRVEIRPKASSRYLFELSSSYEYFCPFALYLDRPTAE